MKKVVLGTLIALSLTACGGNSPAASTEKSSSGLSHNQEILNGQGPKDAINLAVVYTFDEENDQQVQDLTKTTFQKIGLYQNDAHHRVNVVYERNYGKTALETITFSPMFNDSVVRPLLNKDPRVAGFAPFNFLNYRQKSDGKTIVSHITPEAMMEILEIKDPAIKDVLVKSFKPIDAMIEKELPQGKKSYIKLQGIAKDSMMNFEIPLKDVEDIDDYMDEFQEKFDIAFVKKEFILAGFYNAKDSYHSEEDVLEQYSTFWVYSLCHIPFSYSIFDGENPLPIAAIFGPCSMYVYVKEDENKIVIGMPTLSAWAAALNIKDEKKLAAIHNLDKEITEIIHSLGGVSTDNYNPLTK
jgi:uncharacterized protein (DUF302 family)